MGLDQKMELVYRKRILITFHKSLELEKCDLEVGNEFHDFLGAL